MRIRIDPSLGLIILLLSIFHRGSSSSDQDQCCHSECKCRDSLMDCSGIGMQILISGTNIPPKSHVPYKVANFSHNFLIFIDQRFVSSFHQASIEQYDFSFNSIRHIEPDTFVFNANLKTLDLSHNKLKKVEPRWFTGLDLELQTLNLSWNNLTGLRPETFRKLSRLQFLDLSGNNLTELASGVFAGLIYLAELRVDEANLRLAGVDLFAGLSSLRRVSLRGNRLLTVPDFRGARGLESLALDRNPLVRLPAGAFASAPGLQEISLRSLDRLETVSACAFRSLDRLSRLLMSEWPAVGSPSVGWFGAPGRFGPLRFLDLSRGAFHRLPEALVDWASTEGLLLEGNPWRCDRSMSWVVDLKSKIKDEPKCRTPRSLENRSFVSLTAADFIENASSTIPPVTLSRPVIFSTRKTTSTGGGGGGIFRAGAVKPTPRLFASLAALMLASSTLLITWYVCWSRRKLAPPRPGAANCRRGGELAPSSAAKSAPPALYAYRNLAMLQEEEERAERRRYDGDGTAATDERGDDDDEAGFSLTVNPAFQLLDRSTAFV